MPRSEYRKATKIICVVGRMEALENLKRDKRSLKSSLTKYLNELAVELSLEAPKKEKITERLQDIENRRDELLELLDNLQALYKEKSETTNAASIEEEADGRVDRVDSKTSGARLFLAKGAAKTSDEDQEREIGEHMCEGWSRGRRKQTTRAIR